MLDPDPRYVPEDEYSYVRGFRAGLELRPSKLGLLAFGIAVGLVAGILIGRSTLAATPRSSSDATIPVVSPATSEAPHRSGGVSSGAVAKPLAAAPTSGTVAPLCKPMPCGDPPAPRHSVAGTASWFAAPDNEAAAGPGLRQALGARWRGTRVTVWTGSRCLPAVHGRPSPNCVVVTLTDWCQCGNGRVIDLDRGQFARLAPLSKGLVPVRVTW